MECEASDAESGHRLRLLRPPRQLAWVAVALLCVLAAGAVLARRWYQRLWVGDALQTAATEILRQANEGGATPDQAAIDAVFCLHHELSVSPIWMDRQGRPVDAWGTRFRVGIDSRRPCTWVECSSAGPDGEFGTDDDLTFRAEN